MDFGTLLQTANSNNSSRNGGNFYKTKFEPPKKESKNKTLSSNIQKFLAKKEHEDRIKAAEAKQKRDELMAKRDTKANNKIKKMLKVIKSANKSVLEDAVDNVNTAVTMNGPDQPDEDDYGYVSQEASAFYSKMMEKYKNIPDEDKFSSGRKNMNQDLGSTKDRVRAAILRQQEEELLPHKRKRKSNNTEIDRYEESSRDETKKDDKPKSKRPPMPPPLDFTELLKIAEKKQFEPVIVEPKKPEVLDEAERPMTKKQRREYEEEKAFKEARLRRQKERAAAEAAKSAEPRKSQNESNPKPISKNPSVTSMRIPKLSDKLNKTESTPSKSDERPKSIDNKNKVSITKNNLPTPKDRLPKVPIVKSVEPSKPKDNPVMRNDSSKAKPMIKNSNIENKPKMAPSIAKPDTNPFRTANSKNIVPQKNSPSDKMPVKNLNNKLKPPIPQSSKVNPSAKPSLNSKPDLQNKRPQMQPGNSAKVAKPNPGLDNKGVRQFPPNDVQRPRQFPPADVRGPRQFPPGDVRAPKLSKEAMLRKQKLAKRRIIDDDDSEYDSSLEDFIDDGPEEGGDVSKYIKEIFGYDKSRYRDVDDDDRNMESNYSQVMREEYISKKMGIMEDLEDMKMEAMEKKKMTQQSKKRKLK